jgi:hypothetical protein
MAINTTAASTNFGKYFSTATKAHKKQRKGWTPTMVQGDDKRERRREDGARGEGRLPVGDGRTTSCLTAPGNKALTDTL